MKLLLVQVPTSHLGAGERVYPLGLSRLSSVVPNQVAGQAVDKRALDMNLSALNLTDPWEDLKTALEDFQPEIIALSFRNLDPLAGQSASYLSSLRTAARMARLLAPDARILAGGPAFSLFGVRLMEEIPEIDYGLIGEGEAVFPKLLEPTLAPDQLPGLVWRREGQVTANELGAKLHMDEIPPMDVDLFPPKAYTKGNAYVAAVGIEGKRGCDLSCGYCRYPFLGGTCMRLRSPSRIVDEMEYLHREHGIGLFHFTDGVVNRPVEHFEALCQELLDRKLDITWTGFFREDTLTDRNLALAQKSGLCAVYFSADALTQAGLNRLGKQLTMDQVLEASRVTARANMLTMCHFLVNLPGDSVDDLPEIHANLDALLDIHHPVGNLGAVIFNHIRLYPDAPVTRRLLRRGELPPDTDLLYPVFHNPPELAHLLHELEGKCHTANVFSRFGLKGNHPWNI